MRIGFRLPASRRMFNALLEGLTLANCEVLRKRGNLPRLYQSRVRYRQEPPGREDWLTADQVLKRGFGDCEDLAAWRAAEWRMHGVPARAVAKRTGRRMYHAVVELPDGSIEDPSAMLGMKSRRRR